MAFISMVFVGVMLIVVVIGIIALGIGSIIDLIWIVREALKKKTHVAVKVAAVLFTLAGILLFVLPVGGVYAISKYSQYTEKRDFERIENKVYLNRDSVSDEFDYKNMHMVYVDFLNVQAGKDVTLELDGVLITSNDSKYKVYSVENDNDFELYRVDRLLKIYCDENEYEDLYEYYHNSENLDASVEKLIDGSLVQQETSIPSEIIFEIRDVYDNHRDGVFYGDSEDRKNTYYFVARSRDHLFYESVFLYEVDDHILLSWTSSGGNFSALYLPEHLENDVKEILEID